MESQVSLLRLLNDGLIERLFAHRGSISEFLELRDNPIFDERWIRQFKEIELRKAMMSKAESTLSDQIRETAYLRAYSKWKSPDLAACISDDFGLISDAYALGIDEPRIDEMVKRYKSGG